MTILITAGSTVEPVDPVRYMSNYSTGMMGFELARAALKHNHNVILISGPVAMVPPKGVKFIPVKTALDMRRNVIKFFSSADCVVMAAAVADFRPSYVSNEKIKKLSNRPLVLKFIRNPDILAELGNRKNGKILVGYSLDTERSIENAKKKLKSKNLDIIVANKVGVHSDPFGPGVKNVTIIDRKGNVNKLEHTGKAKIASFLLSKIENTTGY